MVAIIRCEQSQTNNLMKLNYYISKTSINTTEMKGNMTFLIPLDDSLNVSIAVLLLLNCIFSHELSLVVMIIIYIIKYNII